MAVDHSYGENRVCGELGQGGVRKVRLLLGEGKFSSQLTDSILKALIIKLGESLLLPV